MIITSVKKRIAFVQLSMLFLVCLAAAILTTQYVLLAVPFAVVLFYAGWQTLPGFFYLLIVSIPFSFEYNFTASLGTDIPDEGLMLMTSVLFFAYWLYKPSLISAELKRHPLLLLLLLHIGWIVVCVFTSSIPVISLKFFLSKGWYICSFVLAPLLLFTNQASIKKAAVVLGVSILIATIIIMIRHSLTGFSFASINKAVVPFFRNHVNYSSMLVCSLPLFFAFYAMATTRRMRATIITAIVLLLVAVFFTYSRGAWLALAVGCILSVAIRKRILLSAYIICCVLVLGVFCWLKSGDHYLQYAHDYRTTIYHENFNQHLTATYQLKDLSTQERFYRWIAGVRMIGDHPIHGVGPGTFYDNYRSYTIPLFKTWVSDNPERSTVHNYFLLLAIEQGIPGLLFFLVLLGALFYYVQRVYHTAEDTSTQVIAHTVAIILGMIMTVNFLSDLIETDKVGSLFFLCLSVIVVMSAKTPRDKQHTPVMH